MWQTRVKLFLKKILLCIMLISPVLAEKTQKSKPRIQQATQYKAVNDISQYWISEKLDGMRGYWDGKQLFTRQGNKIHNPSWFTKDWPTISMDGELWVARDEFQSTVSCVRRIKINDDCWRNVRFMIFDLPNHKATFTDRIKMMKNLTSNTQSNYLHMIQQVQLKNNQQLDQLLTNIISKQGEGLMVHKANSYYYVGRSSNLMKFKKVQDAEAIVIAYIGGKGKYKGMLGAITVQTETGIIFNIGSGFSDNERANPPAIGSTITYKYNGKTKANIPRFARFFRIRNKE